MNLNTLTEKVIALLADYQVKDLPNQPNLNGIFEQTDITFAIISGQRSDNGDYILIKLNVSIAATLRATQTQADVCYYSTTEEKTLYGLMSSVIYKLQKQKIENGGLLKLLSFENFTPESGKWRSLLTFEVNLPIQSAIDDNELCL